MEIILSFGKKTKEEAIGLLEDIEKQFETNLNSYKEKVKKADIDNEIELVYYGNDKKCWALENVSESEVIFDHETLECLKEKKYDNLDISRIVEVGIILTKTPEYQELIKKCKNYDLEDFGNLCINLYNTWSNIDSDKLKCEENFGYITEFMNNETEIVSKVIKEWVK